MIKFEFKVDDFDAEYICDLFQDDIAKMLTCIQKDMASKYRAEQESNDKEVEKYKSQIAWYEGRIEYVKKLRDQVSASTIKIESNQ